MRLVGPTIQSQRTIWYRQHMHRDTEYEQDRDVYKVLSQTSQSGGLQKAVEKVTGPATESRLGVLLGLVWGGDADGPQWQTGLACSGTKDKQLVGGGGSLRSRNGVTR